MRKLILLVCFVVLLAIAVSADDNATNTTINYNITFCDNISLNSTVHWNKIFVCSMNNTLFGCCNNETLCEDIWQTNCSPITYLLPFFNQPGGEGDDGNNDNGGNDDNDNNNNPANTVNINGLNIQPGSPRGMRLLVSGEYVGEPIIISANNIFGSMGNVELQFYKDDELIRRVVSDGSTEIIFDEPGAYVVKSYRAGYVPQTSRFFLYSRSTEQSAPSEVVEPEPTPVEVVVEPQSEPAEYDRLSGMVTMTSPKGKLNLGRSLLIGLLVVAVLGVLGKMFLFRKSDPPKGKDQKIDWNF